MIEGIWEEINIIVNKNKARTLCEVKPEIISALGKYSIISAEAFILKLSDHVSIPAPKIQVWYGGFSAGQHPAHYSNGVITIKQYEKFNANLIAGILAHEFSHYFIDHLKLKWKDLDLNKQERLVDLIAIFLGFGKFIINGKILEQNDSEIHVGYLGLNECVNAFYWWGKINNITNNQLSRDLKYNLSVSNGEGDEQGSDIKRFGLTLLIIMAVFSVMLLIFLR